MRNEILRELSRIEAENRVRILYAAESGSRAWGFPSPDSDYDVRFLYIRPREDYLRLDKARDVIEGPAGPVLDINGWDLRKALRLFGKSNPALYEWLASPIVYRTSPFTDRLRALEGSYFAPKRFLHHYLNMALANYNAYLCLDQVKAKKYFYALRPLLAGRWIIRKASPPPVSFAELAASELDPARQPEVRWLLELKQQSPEARLIPKVPQLSEYIESSLWALRQVLLTLPDEPDPSLAKLNELFFSELNQRNN